MGAGYDDVNIEWTSDNPCAVIDGSQLVITLPEEEALVTVTAKAVVGEAFGEKSFTISVDALSTILAGGRSVSEYKEHVPYGLYTYQANIEKRLFFTGEISGKYLSTSDKYSKVASVYLEKDGEGWRIYTIVDGAKFYVEIVDGKAALNSEPVGNVWTINSDVNVPVTMVGETEYYLGCYKTYDTFSASKTSYILSDTSVIGVSQFPMQIVEVMPGFDANDWVRNFDEEVECILLVEQNNIEETLYFNGTINGGKYLRTTKKFSEAVTIKSEMEGEGFRLYFMDGETKTYIEIVDGKAALNTEVKGNVWTYSQEGNTFVTKCGDTDYYLGCYKTYDTFSASKTSYILSDTSVIGVSQFPMKALTSKSVFVTMGLDLATEVEEDEIYVYSVEQNNIGKVLFFTGDLTGGKYLATSNDFGYASPMKVQKEGEGFRLYFIDGEGKHYVEIIDGKATVNSIPQGSVWVLDPDTGVIMTDCGGTMYYLGCYKTYDTFSASKTSYISDTTLIGVSQFPARLYKVSFNR